MPFRDETQVELEKTIQQVLAIEDWSGKDEALDQIADACRGSSSSLPSTQEMILRFESRHHEHYANKHNLQKFFADIIQFAVRSQSNNPVAELVIALEKKLIQ